MADYKDLINLIKDQIISLENRFERTEDKIDIFINKEEMKLNRIASIEKQLSLYEINISQNDNKIERYRTDYMQSLEGLKLYIDDVTNNLNEKIIIINKRPAEFISKFKKFMDMFVKIVGFTAMLASVLFGAWKGIVWLLQVLR